MIDKTAKRGERGSMTFARHNFALTRPKHRLDPQTGHLDLPDHRLMLRDDDWLRIVDISASADNPPPPGHAAQYQVVLPYHGVFRYHRGRDAQLIDTNRTLLVSAGCDFADDHPIRGLGHASLVLIPASEALGDFCGSVVPKSHQAFARGSQPASRRLRLLTHRILAARDEALALDELAVAAIGEAVTSDHARATRGISRPVERAKEYLHDSAFGPVTLASVARAAGVTPVHLAHEFRCREGISLFRYRMRLRLDRALLELPGSADITALALDLGFSSHSHFTQAFRSHFGITPSRFRAATTRRTH
ncbi:helix-turn-helix transcriptional regulator [Sphingosinicella sp.]|uniref:helix-turn-helix transcriptional regulator n=1 Tax=Sphingosinicella sp. TaxID=1917971 RepID=UPI0040382F05